MTPPAPPKPRFSEFKAKVVKTEDPLPDHRIIRFALDKEIAFTPGQFVQVLVDGINKPASFSIANSPTERNEIELAYHKVGRVTGAMSMMVPGTTCTLRGPFGRFTFTADDGDIVCLAGGVGITPFICAARFIRDFKLPNKYTLLYSAKSKQGLLYFDELKEMADSHANMDVVFSVTREIPDNWQGETRRVDAAMITTHIPDYKERTYYVCGPRPFIEAMIELVKGLGVPGEKIRRELW